MKTLITILATALIVSTSAYILCGLKSGIMLARQMSEADYPMTRILEDIAATADAGDCELANSKVALLRRHWEDYQTQGSTPDQFMHEIINLTE